MIEIRPAVEEDVPQILDIYNYAVRQTAATFDLEEQNLAERLEWFSHYGGAYPLIVGVKDGRIAGYSSLSMFRTKPAYSKTVELSVYIEPEHWGQGIAKLLITEILRQAKQLGHHTVISAITGNNQASIRLHEIFGFRNVGCLQEVGYKFGAWHDVIFYQLIL